MMVTDASDAELEALYRSLPSLLLKRCAIAFSLDKAQAYVIGPELETFCDRRLVIIRKVLEERGEVFPIGRMF